MTEESLLIKSARKIPKVELSYDDLIINISKVLKQNLDPNIIQLIEDAIVHDNERKAAVMVAEDAQEAADAAAKAAVEAQKLADEAAEAAANASMTPETDETPPPTE